MRAPPAEPQVATASRTRSSIACSPALTCSARKPMKPPSLAASAAAWALADQPRAVRRCLLGSTPWPPRPPRTPRSSASTSSPTAGPGGLVALERVPAFLHHRLDVERHVGQQLLAARRVGGGLHRGHRLLRRLDGAARVGQGDRQPGHERCPHDPGPFLLGEVALRRHAIIPSSAEAAPRPRLGMAPSVHGAHGAVIPLGGGGGRRVTVWTSRVHRVMTILPLALPCST